MIKCKQCKFSKETDFDKSNKFLFCELGQEVVGSKNTCDNAELK